MGLFTQARDAFASQSHALNSRTMSREELQRFWIDVYSATLDEIPSNPSTTAEYRRVDQAKETLSRWATNFDLDRSRTGLQPTAWTALNAVTEYFDHQTPVRAPSESARAENRLYGRLWGTAAIAKTKAMELALSR
jgi:hypothetical protein